MKLVIRLCVAAACGLWSVPAFAQQPQTMTDLLSFLLVNRSISTGDFVRDERAAEAARDAIAGLLRVELANRPVTSPASGFSYRLDPALGTTVRSSESFGPFYTERSLTLGRRLFAVSVSFGQASYDNIDGRKLRNGTLVSTASQLEGETQPFDVETLALHLRTRVTTVAAHFGITDRLDVSAVVPFVTLTMSGDRVDTYRGTAFPQATAFGSASGLGDILVRTKFNATSRGASGLSVVVDVQAPTGNANNLLGAGKTAVTPGVVVSIDRNRLAVHGEAGYTIVGASRAINYGVAVTAVARPRLTLVGELTGRRIQSGGRLVEVTAPRPGLVGVNSIWLTATEQATSRVSIVAGLRWNIASRWVWSVSAIQPLTASGLNAHWVPTTTLDVAWGR